MELAERMQKTQLGQVTWVNPDLGKKCLECKYANNKWPSASNRKTHICTLVKNHTGKNGVPYDAVRAIACSKFEGVDT